MGIALTGCGALFGGPDAAVTRLTPALVRPGETVVVDGRALDAVDGVVFTAEGGARRRQAWVSVTSARATFTLPDAVASGLWSVQLAVDGEPMGEGTPLEVWTPATEPACGKRFALKVRTERTTRRVLIEHVLPDGTVTSTTFEGAQLRRLEHAVAPGCEAIWLHTGDGGRWLLADRDDGSLAEQVAALAEALDLPVSPSTEVGARPRVSPLPGTSPAPAP